MAFQARQHEEPKIAQNRPKSRLRRNSRKTTIFVEKTLVYRSIYGNK